ncbi:MAG: hypothetical protein QOE45_1551 [Frankiaceae bacterium]|jgi:hypothetical protein|nr:hypothetical protein [Frankiaceae bacterium]
MHPNAQRVQRALADAGSAARVVELTDSARTAAEAAAALGVSVGQIANSLVFVAGGAPLLVMTSGANRVDTHGSARCSARPSGVPTRTPSVPPPGSRSAASRRSASPRPSASWSTRTCSATT